MSYTPIIDGLLKFVSENNVSFHMPGHMNNERHFKELEIIKKYMYEMDNTEVPGLDNLHVPEGMILESEKNAAELYHAGETFFLVNGSTSGVYAMILGVTKPGDRIIIQRNCHRSVYTACILGGLKTSYIEPSIMPEFDIPVSVDINNVIKSMDENRDARAVVITYPTYYGTCCDLKRIVDEAHKRNMLVLVDEAHGAHFPFSSRLPENAMELLADVSVDSVHKTLPAMTQTAVLNVRNGMDTDGIRFMASTFQSTSPSYILMASIETSLAIMHEQGEKLLDEVISNVQDFKSRVSKFYNFAVLEKGDENITHINDIDLTRIVMNSRIGGRETEEILRKKYNIQAEMSDMNNIVFISTVGNTKDDFEKLYNALKEIDNDNFRVSTKKINGYPKYEQVLSLKEAYYSKRKCIKLEDSTGLICAEMVVPYPPGIPLIVPGEVISCDIIDYIKEIRESGFTLNGIKDPKGEYIEVLQ